MTESRKSSNGLDQKTEIGEDISVQPVSHCKSNETFENHNIAEDTQRCIKSTNAKTEVANPFFNCELDGDKSRVFEPNSDYTACELSGNYTDAESSLNMESTLTASFIPSLQEGETTVDGDSANTTEAGKFVVANNNEKYSYSHTF